MTTFNLPDLGEGLAEAEIVNWHVKVGDRVKLDQPMLSVETAKAVVEVPSPYSGTIKALHAKAGDIVPTGSALVDFDVEGAAPKKAADSGTVVGNMPTSDEELIENVTTGGNRSATQDRVRAAPAVRALAKKLGVELTHVQGSGRGGLITVDDVMGSTSRMVDADAVARAGTRAAIMGVPIATSASSSAVAPAPRAPAPAAAPASAAATQARAGVVASNASGSTNKTADVRPAAPAADGVAEPLRGLRRGMAHSMALARDSVANCTLFDDADLHHWLRKSDFTVRLIRAVGVACRVEPSLNAHFDGEKLTRQIHSRVDLAVAVDTPEGLIVPVIRDIGAKQPEQLRNELKALKEASRTRTVAPEALRDFTFMLSNFGMIAGRYATPLVVPPAVAILGSGKLQHDVVAVMGSIEAHLRMPLSLTFDHRCITGGEAARFLAAVIEDLQLAE